MRYGFTIASVSAGIALAACGGDSGTDANAVKVVQITEIKSAPSSVSCVSGLYPYELRVNIKILNNTDADVPVVQVRSSGVVIRATNNLDVGQYVHVQDTLAFLPLTLKAKNESGTKTLEVTLDARCGSYTHNANPLLGGGYKDIQTTFWVRTSTGEYATLPIVTHLAYAN